MGDTFIRHIALLGFEKRFAPSQHYVSSPSAFSEAHSGDKTVFLVLPKGHLDQERI